MEIKPTAVTYLPKHVNLAPVNTLKTNDLQQRSNEMYDKITREMLENKVDKMNEFIEPSQTTLKFQLHEKLKVYYVQIIDTKSEEILKEIPQRKFLDMYASMTELMGLIVDDKL